MHRSSNVNGIFVPVFLRYPRYEIDPSCARVSHPFNNARGDQTGGDHSEIKMRSGLPHTGPEAGRNGSISLRPERSEGRFRRGAPRISKTGVLSKNAPWQCGIETSRFIDPFVWCSIAQDGLKEQMKGNKALHKRALSEINGNFFFGV